VRAATGWSVDEQEMRTVVSWGLSLARLFNLREGMTTADDRLPQRLHEPTLKGPLSAKRLSKDQVRTVVTDYYVQQGWDPDSGAPVPGTLEALDIAGYAGRAVVASANGPVLPPIVAAIASAPEEKHQE
jgi:aldehyde:ferredoxin oxidoreductase